MMIWGVWCVAWWGEGLIGTCVRRSWSLCLNARM
jgi:hypothetical protein